MSRPYFNVKSIYTGTGSLSAYTFDFKITLLEQIRIVIVDNTNEVIENIRGDEASAYVDTIVPDEQEIGGGVVNLIAPLQSGYRMVLLLEDPEPSQDFEFKNKTSFTLNRFESALDRIVGSIQGFVLKTRQSLRIHSVDDEESFNPELPPGIDTKGNRVLAVNEDGDGFQFGPTIEDISEAAQAALDAINAKDAAEAAAITATDGANQAGLILFNGEITLSDADSPVTLDSGVYNNKIIRINATAGDVIINLNPLATYPAGWKAQFIRSDSEPSTTVTIVPNGAETIDEVTDYDLPLGTAVIMSPDTTLNTNWVKKFLGVTSGGGSVPAGGIDGDYMEVVGGVLGFTSGIFTGFSARYNAALNLTNLRDALLYIFQFAYLGPQVSLSASGSGTLREKGVAVTSSTLTAAVTMRSTLISRIQFFLNGVSVDDNNPPATTGTGNTIYAWSGSFSDNSTFRVDVTDTTDGSNGPTTVQSSVAFTFVYPFFWNAGAQDLAVSAIGGKQVVANSNNRNATYTGLSGQVFYYAFPASYGDLTKIEDSNGFDVTSSFTKKTKNFTALDAAVVSYTIYELTTPLGVNLNTNFTFIR